MSNEAKPSTDLLIAALVDPRHTHLFEKAMAKAADSGDVGARNFLHTCPASHGDRLVLELAFSCWRGYGPAVAIDQLSGMDAAVAQRALAGIAMAMAGDDAPELLEKAAARCRELLPQEPEGGESA
jgi:hypothetical protein